jgi:hypothetical protein
MKSISMFYCIVCRDCILVDSPSYVAQINQFKLQPNANATFQRMIEHSFENVFFLH